MLQSSSFLQVFAKTISKDELNRLNMLAPLALFFQYNEKRKKAATHNLRRQRLIPADVISWNSSRLNHSLPSRSSMVFSSLATVRSANSARVSTYREKNAEREKNVKGHKMAWMACIWPTKKRLACKTIRMSSCSNLNSLTSFSLSVRALISSSYLSSFSEYYRQKRCKRL